MQDLTGKTVMITGASRGLGAALALDFARAGALISICARTTDALAETAAAVEDAGGRCVSRAVNVADEDAVAEWVDDTARELGAPAVLINNASVLGPRVETKDYPLEDWRRVMDINLTGVFITTNAVVPRMMEMGGGSIINVSSGAAVGVRGGWGAYAVSKQALETYSFNLAVELSGSGIRVNIVDPGAMRTDMRASAYPDEDPLTLKSPAETTGLFIWLAGRASGDVTGKRLSADEFMRRQ